MSKYDHSTVKNMLVDDAIDAASIDPETLCAGCDKPWSEHWGFNCDEPYNERKFTPLLAGTYPPNRGADVEWHRAEMDRLRSDRDRLAIDAATSGVEVQS